MIQFESRGCSTVVTLVHLCVHLETRSSPCAHIRDSFPMTADRSNQLQLQRRRDRSKPMPRLPHYHRLSRAMVEEEFLTLCIPRSELVMSNASLCVHEVEPQASTRYRKCAILRGRYRSRLDSRRACILLYPIIGTRIATIKLRAWRLRCRSRSSQH